MVIPRNGFFYPILTQIVYLRNKETQQTLQIIVSILCNACFSATDVNSLEQYVSVNLLQVQHNYRLRMPVGMRVTSPNPQN